MLLSSAAFVVVFVLSGTCLNYLDTGNIFKILPGHKIRFFLTTLVSSSVTALLALCIS
jgi:hypothetical protein